MPCGVCSRCCCCLVETESQVSPLSGGSSSRGPSEPERLCCCSGWSILCVEVFENQEIAVEILLLSRPTERAWALRHVGSFFERTSCLSLFQSAARIKLYMLVEKFCVSIATESLLCVVVSTQVLIIMPQIFEWSVIGACYCSRAVWIQVVLQQ